MTGLRRRFSEKLKEARLGVREAQYDVGLMYANGLGVEGNLSQAIYWIRQSAEKGHAGAQYLLGTRYVTGVGVEKNPIHAQYWLQKAAFQGHGKAHLRLGRLHQDSASGLAQGYYAQADAMGVPEAAYFLGAQAQTLRDWPAAIAWYTKSAAANDARGIHALATARQHGWGGGPDIRESVVLFRKAAGLNYPPSIVALHELDSTGYTRSTVKSTDAGGAGHDRRMALADWSATLDPDDARARYCLGRMYELGIKVPSRITDAKTWYRAAALMGERDACWALARLLRRDEQYAEFDEWCRRAAELGVPQAQLELGRKLSISPYPTESLKEAIFWLGSAANADNTDGVIAFADFLLQRGEACSYAFLLSAAQRGQVAAQCQVGLAHRDGALGVNVDRELALHWLGLSAQGGNVQAQVALASMLASGLGVKKDPDKALYWYLLAAQQGDAVAQWNVSNFFRLGTGGVAKDLKQAYMWCLKSASQGFAPAKAALGVLMLKMKKSEEGGALLWEAAKAGDGEAQFNLALWLEQNPANEQVFGTSLDWCFRAAQAGISIAQAKLGLRYVVGDGVLSDLVEACKWFYIASQHGERSSMENLKKAQALLTAAQVGEAQRRAHSWLER